MSMKSFTLAIGALVGVLLIGTGTALAEDNRIDHDQGSRRNL